MRLAELQGLFWKAVRDHSPPSGLSDAFVSRGMLDATRRMEIYHAAYWARHEQCLKETYPQVLALLGEQTFHSLVAYYIAAQPSRGLRLTRFDGQRNLLRSASVCARPLAPVFLGIDVDARTEPPYFARQR